MFIYLEYMFNVKQISFCLMSLLSNQVQLEKELGVKTESLPREKWDTWDPTLISEVQEYKIQINTKIQKNAYHLSPSSSLRVYFMFCFIGIPMSENTAKRKTIKLTLSVQTKFAEAKFSESVCGGKYLIETKNVQTTSTFHNISPMKHCRVEY